jgi:hypothetical protein
MDGTPEQPLEIPTHTLVAFHNARRAALRTRQTVEVSRAPLLAGLGLTFISLGSFIIAIDASLPDWARWAIAGPALVESWCGVVLTYAFVWTWLRQGRWGGRRSPFSDPFAPHSSRNRFGVIAAIFFFVLLESIGWQALKAHVPDGVYFGVMIWGTRLAVLMGAAFFVNRYLRSGFWEYLIFAAGILATAGLYIFVPHHQLNLIALVPAFLSVLSMLTATVAAESLHRRWRQWTRANESAAELEELASAERE